MGIALKSSFTDDLPFVEADIGLIERALENIINNATRYTERRDHCDFVKPRIRLGYDNF